MLTVWVIVVALKLSRFVPSFASKDLGCGSRKEKGFLEKYSDCLFIPVRVYVQNTLHPCLNSFVEFS